MTVTLVAGTAFSHEVFGKIDYGTFGKKFPQLLVLAFRLQDADPTLIVSRGPITQTTTPSGVVVCATYQVWRSVLPELLANPATTAVAARINALLAKIGLSCR